MIEGIQASELIKQANEIELTPQSREIKPQEGDSESFANVLTDAINSVDETMKASDNKVQEFVAGESDNVHDVMISMQKAKLSFDLMVEVRNKVVETYQEVSRMQI
ncbi:flagellar hook-basal body complex protein FliE [Fodinibius saliphilus]|uniref:flagellar hook-basal body complex protein FliE n=1 Tax=Fodinibius saliphilus TaxID=1920650 RepID=UPI001108E635|nr:flagellar hook-basal body complex protein FliE [Fodinibius saliphilus]